MITNKTKNKREDRFQSLFLPVIVGIAFFGAMTFLVVSNVRITQKRADLGEEIASLEAQITALEEVKDKYEQGLISAEEAVYWEEKLREQGYKKPGEEAVVVLPGEEAEQESDQGQSVWDRIKGFFGF
ncbi:MAG: hypothetical protein WC302_01290 [Candidatus Paceibacterota bacterium]|jgi:cell division protein FtsB